MNVFEVVKENVTARQAAESYGLKVGRTVTGAFFVSGKESHECI